MLTQLEQGTSVGIRQPWVSRVSLVCGGVYLAGLVGVAKLAEGLAVE